MNSPSGRPTKWRESIDCGCKVNLRLKVTARRPDKLHDLSSCFVFLPHPGDRLTVESRPGSALTLEVPGHPELAGEKNLLWIAAERYAEKCGITPDWLLILEKNVPVAAGLGGGSADAGALLALLNRHYALLNDDELKTLAFSLGADVPFFLERRTAWVTGAGENLEFLETGIPLPEILIVNPGFPVSAKWAFTHMAPELISGDDPAEKAAFTAGRADWKSFCCNDLAPAVFHKFPLLGILRDELLACGAAAVQMSGSGSSLFAVFPNGGAASAAEMMKKEFCDLKSLRIFTGGKEF